MEGPRPAHHDCHRRPPYSPRHLFGRPLVLELSLTVVVVLAALAAYDGGRLLRQVDAPIQRWIAENRTDAWTDFFEAGSRLGDNVVVFALALVVAAVTWHRCRYLAIALVAAVAFRPALEFVVKALVDRPRPEIDPLGEFMGPSHPSGHPLAAVSVWGLLPPVAAVFGARRWLWEAIALVVTVVIAVVGAARVYKGAHWFTDVVASAVWGALFLLVVELAWNAVHTRMGWGPEAEEEDEPQEAPAAS